MARYFIATHPDGTVFKRSSAHRAYTHCVVAKRETRAATEAEIAANATRMWFNPAASTGYYASWAGRPDLAYKALADASKPARDPRATRAGFLLDAVEVDGKTFRATQGISPLGLAYG